MADAGFFKGTSTDQDRRFSDKEMKLLKTMKFPQEFEKKVDMRKVNIDVMRPWIANKVVELVGFEDEVVVEYAMGLLEDPAQPLPDPKKMQINLTGFLTGKTPAFMSSLWSLLLEAQDSPGGIPISFVEAKKEELRKANASDSRTFQERERRANLDDIRDRERSERQGFRGRGGRGRGRGRDGFDDRAGRGRGRDNGWSNRGGRPSRFQSPRRSRSPPRRSRSPVRRRSFSPRRRDNSTTPPFDASSRSPPPHRDDSPLPRRDSRSPPARDSRSPSPPPRRRIRSPSYSPPRRRRQRSPTTSPPPARRRRSPRRRVDDSYVARDSRSPPARRRRYDSRSRSASRSPRYARRRSSSHSRSPPRRRIYSRSPPVRNINRSRSHSKGRGKRRSNRSSGSRSPPPARRPRRSSTPPRRDERDKEDKMDFDLPLEGGELKIKGQAERQKRKATSTSDVDDMADINDNEKPIDHEKLERELKEKALRSKVVRSRQKSFNE